MNRAHSDYILRWSESYWDLYNWKGSIRRVTNPERHNILCTQRSVTGLFKNIVSAEHCWCTWGRMINPEYVHLFYCCKVCSDVTSDFFFFLNLLVFNYNLLKSEERVFNYTKCISIWCFACLLWQSTKVSHSWKKWVC